MQSFASFALSGVGLISGRAERRIRSRFRVYPDVIELSHLPSGRRAPIPIRMYAQDGADQIVKRLFGGGWNYEAPQPALFEAALRMWRPGAVIDVGANTGAYSLLCAAACDREIIALEPIPDIMRMLRDNISLNSFARHVQTLLKAASSYSGSATISLPETGGNLVPTSATLNASILSDTISDSFEIETVTIDDVCHHKEVAILKIDVEGFEESALAGAKELLYRCHPIVFCEILVGRNKGLGNIPDLLKTCGYMRAALRPTSVSVQNGRYHEGTWDYILFHHEDAGSIEKLCTQSGMRFNGG